MSVIGMWGFEGHNKQRDGLVVFDYDPVYLEAPVPPGGSVLSIRGSSSGTGSTMGSPLDSSVTEFWYTFKWYFTQNGTGNSQSRVGWTDGADNVGGWVSRADNTALPTIYINGSLVATGGAAHGNNEWKTYHVHVILHAATGVVEVFRDGDLTTPVVSYTGNTAGAVPTAVKAYMRLHNSCCMDDVVYMDPNDGTGIVSSTDIINPAILPKFPTSDGDLVQWVATPGVAGDYTDVDERADATASPATGRLNMNLAPVDGNTVVIDGKTYTWKASLTDVDGYVLIGGTVAASLDNIYAAINLSGSPGVQYASSTTLHPTVQGTTNANAYIVVDAKTAGSLGNAIDVSVTTSDPNTKWVDENDTLTDISFLVGGDDAPADSYVQASAINQVELFGFGGVTDGVVLAVKLKGHVMRGDTAAGSQVRAVGRQASVSYPKSDQSAPSDGDVFDTWNLAPDGTAWNNAKFAASQFGLESRT